MIKKYQKKPVVIEAVIFNGHNFKEIGEWMSDSFYRGGDHEAEELYIRTLEDHPNTRHVASKCDFIIKGVAGEFYACKSDIFLKTYEEV